jgi:hypothetical protein
MEFLPSFIDTGEKPSIPSFIPKQVLDQVPVMPAPVSDLPDTKLSNSATNELYWSTKHSSNAKHSSTTSGSSILPPAASIYQPRVEDIISPIRTGSTRRLPQPGLFNLR